MDNRRLVRRSKFLARVLRHEPELLGLTLDPAGWVAVDDLLAACRRAGVELTPADLDEVVARNDKSRFAFSPDRRRVRAQQGHSVPVRLDLPETVPPTTLYHGTVGPSLPAIFTEGLRPMARHDVHLSPDPETARRVGARRGRPVVLRVAAGRMHADGHAFRVSGNGVWLVPAVPAHYLDVLPEDPAGS
ncbi:RNA 2'-phosphotransferase [Marinitenerispora sediminis]|uniref:Probable RNA 2'-phosphotransferase n=1 Tax=Marinitenerispora sediminis TaxID=1931232 RepID=A0A368TC88_9ACTN|nr:RNA 2'-phosphotransferase [Marinitenerispora sediminis]RCV52378.1 RNA 2'-phosphotransferase [Marinitenerispora sediminis]RCV60940.1 RNA 2'-phosphotransferase [Marinitenerispora sediminis]RCV62233.1 RNA 2'-phosphotransferase [Marinitenerispora sediminis]